MATKQHTNTAKTISNAFQPALTVPIGSALVGYLTLGLPYGLIFAVLTGILPVAVVFISVKTGLIVSRTAPLIKQRFALLLALTLIEAGICAIYYATPPLQSATPTQGALTIGLATATAATHYTKISMHCAVIGIFGTAVAYSLAWTIPITAALLIVVAHSRITTRAHTTTQALLGSLLPSISTALLLQLTT